jgi:transposase
MFDVNDDAKGGYRRIEVLTGPGRRRRWSVDEKARIVAETLVAGARVSEVARRWQVCPQQVFGWRRAEREDVPVAAANTMNAVVPDFVPIVSASEPATVPSQPSPPAVIEVKLAGAVVRVVSGMDGAMLTAVLRAIRASASSP